MKKKLRVGSAQAGIKGLPAQTELLSLAARIERAKLEGLRQTDTFAGPTKFSDSTRRRALSEYFEKRGKAQTQTLRRAQAMADVRNAFTAAVMGRVVTFDDPINMRLPMRSQCMANMDDVGVEYGGS
jgi:hypothetical protein